jgi:CBS domain-containing protein
MTGKRKSNDNVRQARRSEADLGQKAAKLEKASEEELRHMGGSDAAASARRQGRSAMKVQIAMHKGVEWVGPDTPVAELAELMRKHDIGAIPIGENDQLIGMVTDRDIVCKGLAKDSFDARRATARDVMTSGIHCCREDDDLAKAVRHMEELKIRRLPVINKSMRMVGILSLGDVSHAAPGDLVSECVKSVSAHHR